MSKDIQDLGEGYIPRIVDEVIARKLRTTGAVVIQGPKWCGKSTTAVHVAASNIKMDLPDMAEQYRQMAQMQPSLLLQGEVPRLIDEWQVAPNLWNAVRSEVDVRRAFGQFILTGSAVPKRMKAGTHSGTGRFSWVRMRPLSLFESSESNGSVSLRELFAGKPPCAQGIPYNLEDIGYLICRGGWPMAIQDDREIALAQAVNYYDAVINEDIIRASEDDEDEIRLDPERAKRVLRSYARNLSQQIPIETIRQDALVNDTESFSKASLYAYLSFLKRIFVLEDGPAWNPNLRSKAAIRSTETRYFSDPSIGTSALGIGPGDLVNDLRTMGFFFENLCVRDLRVYTDVLDGEVYHYRDSSGLECDTVIHLRNGQYGLAEIKLGSESGIAEGIENLKRLENKIDTDQMNAPAFKMIVVGRTNFAYRRDDGIDIVPISCLRP